jgi:type VI secretion system secreted protein Hcp
MRRINCVGIVIATALLLGVTSPSSGIAAVVRQENAFLKLGAIKGKAKTDKFADQIVFQSMSYGVNQAGEWEEGDRLSGNITTFADLVITKEVDSASPSLALACAMKQQFPKAEISLVSGKDVYSRVTLEDVIVSKVSVEFHSGEARPTEIISLRYRSAMWEWGTSKAGYDLRKGKK